MAIHELKTWPEFFEHVASGAKTFEARQDDRGFRVGDELLLREWQPKSKRYTGREVRRTVTYLMAGPAFGLAPGYVVMALAAPEQRIAELERENARQREELVSVKAALDAAQSYRDELEQKNAHLREAADRRGWLLKLALHKSGVTRMSIHGHAYLPKCIAVEVPESVIDEQADWVQLACDELSRPASDKAALRAPAAPPGQPGAQTEALKRFIEWGETALSCQSNCGDPDTECVMQDAHKDYDLAGIIAEGRAALAGGAK